MGLFSRRRKFKAAAAPLVFLDLCAESDKALSPPKQVDAAWHVFLLHTKDYEAYCNERFGKVIHHQPTGKPDPKAYARAHAARQSYAHRSPADTLIWAVPAGVALDQAGMPVTGVDFGGSSCSSGSSCGGGGSSCGGGG